MLSDLKACLNFEYVTPREKVFCLMNCQRDLDIELDRLLTRLTSSEIRIVLEAANSIYDKGIEGYFMGTRIPLDTSDPSAFVSTEYVLNVVNSCESILKKLKK